MSVPMDSEPVVRSGAASGQCCEEWGFSRACSGMEGLHLGSVPAAQSQGT